MSGLVRWIVCVAVSAAAIAGVVAIGRQGGSPNGVAGSVACAACHKTTYDRWTDSIHGKMIQPANPRTVAARSEALGGPAGRRFWRDGSFFIREDGRDNRVELTLGNRRIQHYLSRKPDGQIIVLHSTWDVKRQQWFDSAEIVPNAPPHFVQQWNMTCFYCHVTQQQQDVKSFDPQTSTYNTTWVESSAACERCHGPLAEHASGKRTAASYRADAAGGRYDKLMVCGQCHWAKLVLASGYTTRKNYFDFYSPALVHMDETEPVAPSWWADGRPRRFSMEAAAFFLSRCFQSGQAFCTSCHDPHWNRTDGNDELMRRPDQYCMKCHAGYDKPAHTHHPAASSGASCVGCHMPYAVSGVKTRMRDHTMLGPEPDNTVRYQIPNACNDCHNERTPQWAADYVDRWYPERNQRPRRRAETFNLARLRQSEAGPSLVRLAEDATENPLIRASATGYLAYFPDPPTAAALLRLSSAADPMVRLEAARALSGVAQQDAVAALKRMLSDANRTIRIQAAASLVDQSFAPRPPVLDAQDPQLSSALKEYRASLEVESDSPTMQVRRGSLELFLGQYVAARQAYTFALKLNSKEADAYVGLALVALKEGNPDEALRNARNATNVSDRETYRQFLERIRNARPPGF
jgi:predicted CXXCH cytochrome family protein